MRHGVSLIAGSIPERGADGRLYNVHYTFWFNIRDGKIRELKQYFDTKYAVSYFLDYMTRA